LAKFGTALKTSSPLRNLTLRKSKNKKSSSRLKVKTRIIHQKKVKTRIIHKRGMIVKEIRKWLMRMKKKRRAMRRVSRKWKANLCLQHINLWTTFSKSSSKRLSKSKVKVMKLLSERGWSIKEEENNNRKENNMNNSWLLRLHRKRGSKRKNDWRNKYWRRKS
jgi:hypothetical protein